MQEKFEPQSEEAPKTEIIRGSSDKEFESPNEHIVELENELRHDLEEKRKADDTYLSTIFHKVGVLAAKGKTAYIDQLLEYAKRENIDIDKEALNSVEEAIWDLKESQYASLIFAEDSLKEAKKTYVELVKGGKISSKEAEGLLSRDKEQWGGVELYNAVTTMITMSFLKKHLKEKTVKKIKTMIPQLVIHNPYILNSVKHFSRYYGVDLEETLKICSPLWDDKFTKALPHK